MAEELRTVNASVLGETGSADYTRLAGKIYPSVCSKLYSEAANYHADENPEGEIEPIQEIIAITEDYSYEA